MEILRFDLRIEGFVAQPLAVEYIDSTGRKRSYTPDGLIRFKAAPYQIEPVLFEVKFREDFRKNWRTLAPKFRAAKNYCKALGWRFEVFTEREIRTPYLANVKFLWPYLAREPSADAKALILKTLWDLDEADPDLLLCALCYNLTNRARMIPAVWHLIANGAIGCDLDHPLTMRSPIWAAQDC
ncbi:TnsA endonuclease C terminal [Pseudomonas asturiensis]|uniref:TnsA endonuclease C terminal n=2 Tax=Pseudomonas asturiensis TaxID=1190415 RepID=A0A1M7PZT8_9PSED|nr:TnsA endonuclease C terminal [Pseudomonas asturiensis]